MITDNYIKMCEKAPGVPKDATMKQVKQMIFDCCGCVELKEISALSKKLTTKDTTIGEFFLAEVIFFSRTISIQVIHQDFFQRTSVVFGM